MAANEEDDAKGLPELAPAGDGEQTVRPGECVSSLAYAKGLLPQTVWKHAKNEGLREARGDLNVLLPGDRVHLPEPQKKDLPAVTNQRHRYQRKGVPERLKICLLDDEGQPRVNLAYEFEVNGKVTHGTTGPAGELDLPIPPDAKAAELRIDDFEIYSIELGFLDPANSPSGARARLVNLGYLFQDQSSDAALRWALQAFQTTHDMPSTGELDSETVDALAREHRS